MKAKLKVCPNDFPCGGGVHLVRIFQILRNIGKYMGGLFFSALILLVLAEVICRAVFSAPIYGSDEISSYLLVWTVLVSASYAARSGGHLSLEWLQALLPRKVKYLLQVLVHISAVAVFGIATASSFLTTWKNADTTISSLDLPFLGVFVPIVVGFLMLTLEYSVQLVGLLKNFKNGLMKGS
jgi:TRAP-type C4-dicarboxylate transport system permease small subunit